MNLWDTMRVLGRRWAIVLAVLLLGAAVTARIASGMSDSFQASARMVLLSPTGVDAQRPATEVTPVNPYSKFGSRQDTSVTVIEDLMSSDSVHRATEAKGIVGEWSVTAPDPFRPNLQLTVNEPSPEAASISIWRLIDETEGRWADRQRQL